MSDKTTINDLAPFPADVETMVARDLAKAFAAHGFLASYLAFHLPPNHPDEQVAVTTMLTHFGISFLLRDLIDLAPEQADEVAQGLWGSWVSGNDPAEFLADWLAEDGIDPEEVIRIGAEQVESAREQSETVTVRKDDLVAYLNRGPDMVRETVALGRLLKAAGIE